MRKFRTLPFRCNYNQAPEATPEERAAHDAARAAEIIMSVMSDDFHDLMASCDSTWDQRMLAAWNAEVCGKCGASIAAGDPVWINTYRYYLKAATCAECARRPWDEPELVGWCDGGCGHEVHVRERLDRLAAGYP